MLKRRVKQRRGIGRVWTRHCNLIWVANAKNHQAKIGNARWVQKEGERTTNASIATLLRPSPIAFTTPVKIPAIRISPGP